MASTSYGGTPSDVRRLRAARLNFEPPSFSLGFDIGPVGPTTSCDSFAETGLKRSEEQNWKPPDQVFVLTDDEEGGEDGFPSGNERGTRFKRLKRGPSSFSKQPSQDARDLTRSSEAKSTKDVSECCGQVEKEPVNYFRNHETEDLAGGVKPFDFKENCEDSILSSGSDLENGPNRLKWGPLLVSGDIARSSPDLPKYGVQRDTGSSGGGVSSNMESPPTLVDIRIDTPENAHIPFNGEVDEIEEFSDEELFCSGSRTQKYRRSLRPQMFGTDPVLIISSPENVVKPILHIPGTDIQPMAPKVPLKPPISSTAQTPLTEEDTVLLDDFQSGSDWWRRTRPSLRGPGQNIQQNKNASSGSQRPHLAVNLPETSQLDSSREININSFHTETPLRRDTVGPSQALRNAKVNETEEHRILAFLRRRFPHYKPVDALLMDGDLDNEPVYIDYRNQFADGKGGNPQQHSENTGAGMRWPEVRSIRGAFSISPPSASVSQRRNVGKKKVATKSQPKKQKTRKSAPTGAGRSGSGASGEGKWRTVNGSRVYIVGGSRMTGQRAYAAYNKGRGNSSMKKTKKRPTAKVT